MKNTSIRSRIKDRTIDQLKRDLEDQYYQQDSNEEVLRLQRELEDAKEFYSNFFTSHVTLKVGYNFSLYDISNENSG